MLIECKNPEAVVKEAFWLAYQACGGPAGMGFLQTNATATKEDVWNNVRSAGDYPAGATALMKAAQPGDAYGDYVFGKMMKLGLKWTEKGVEVRDGDVPRRDYQAWCRVYATYEALVQQALSNVDAAELKPVEA